MGAARQPVGAADHRLQPEREPAGEQLLFRRHHLGVLRGRGPEHRQQPAEQGRQVQGDGHHRLHLPPVPGGLPAQPARHAQLYPHRQRVHLPRDQHRGRQALLHRPEDWHRLRWRRHQRPHGQRPGPPEELQHAVGPPRELQLHWHRRTDGLQPGREHQRFGRMDPLAARTLVQAESQQGVRRTEPLRLLVLPPETVHSQQGIAGAQRRQRRVDPPRPIYRPRAANHHPALGNRRRRAELCAHHRICERPVPGRAQPARNE